MKTKKAGALTTVCDNMGQVVLASSYDTCLLVSRGGFVVINTTKYSVTTSKHQTKVGRMPMSGQVVFVSNCPQGADADELFAQLGL